MYIYALAGNRVPSQKITQICFLRASNSDHLWLAFCPPLCCPLFTRLPPSTNSLFKMELPPASRHAIGHSACDRYIDGVIPPRTTRQHGRKGASNPEGDDLTQFVSGVLGRADGKRMLMMQIEPNSHVKLSPGRAHSGQWTDLNCGPSSNPQAGVQLRDFHG